MTEEKPELENITKGEFKFYHNIQKEENKLEALYTKTRGKAYMIGVYAAVSISAVVLYQYLDHSGETANLLQTTGIVTGIVASLKCWTLMLGARKINKSHESIDKLKSKEEYKKLEQMLKQKVITCQKKNQNLQI